VIVQVVLVVIVVVAVAVVVVIVIVVVLVAVVVVAVVIVVFLSEERGYWCVTTTAHVRNLCNLYKRLNGRTIPKCGSCMAVNNDPILTRPFLTGLK
jgi:hypothetical protein